MGIIKSQLSDKEHVPLYIVGQLVDLLKRNPPKEYEKRTTSKADVSARLALRSGIKDSLRAVLTGLRAGRYEGELVNEVTGGELELLVTGWLPKWDDESLHANQELLDRVTTDNELQAHMEELRRDRVLRGDEQPQPHDAEWLKAKHEEIAEQAQAFRELADSAEQQAARLAAQAAQTDAGRS